MAERSCEGCLLSNSRFIDFHEHPDTKPQCVALSNTTRQPYSRCLITRVGEKKLTGSDLAQAVAASCISNESGFCVRFKSQNFVYPCPVKTLEDFGQKCPGLLVKSRAVLLENLSFYIKRQPVQLSLKGIVYYHSPEFQLNNNGGNHNGTNGNHLELIGVSTPIKS